MVTQTSSVSHPDPLARGLDLFQASWLTALPAAFCAVLAGQMPAAYAVWRGLPLALGESKDPLWWLLMLLAAIINLWSWLFIMARQSGLLQGTPPTLFADLRISLAAFGAALTALCLMGLLVMLGTLLLIVPGVYLLVASWLVLPAAVVKGGSAVSIVDTCLRGLRGRWWQTAKGLLLTLIGVLAFFVVGNLLGLLAFELLQLALPVPVLASSLDLLRGLVGAILGALYMPFAAAMAMSHYDLLPRSDQNSASSSL